MRVWPGRWYPLGATFDGSGTNFSVFSELAERVELCLFLEGREERVDLPEVTSYCWHGYFPDVGPGQRYGYRVHGPWAPDRGMLCQPSKLLLDPYARAVDGQLTWHDALFAAEPELDSGVYVPKSVVADPEFEWGADQPPRTALHDTVIYETHVKGFSMNHPGIPDNLRGTYAALAHPASIEHFTKLGVTAVELLPVHQFVHDARLIEMGLRNYWGYQSIGFFAPHNGYSSQPNEQTAVEFKSMVKALHEAGLEVLLDVVYNHTAEGDGAGPILSFKGLDNLAYYRVADDDPARYVDYTGTGNTLNVRHPRVLQLIMDSLRYWVQEMHVDGFRFDLAPALARELHEVDRLSAFFDLILQDPVVSQVKLIAEPWDLGDGGYQVGNFPNLWSEWNGRFRDAVRDYWRGSPPGLPEFAHRFTGSPDLYSSHSRNPWASVNFATCHDGFTLRDLVSYNDKHNEANGQGNRDGETPGSWNCGVEGPTEDPQVNELRRRQARNLLTTVFLSQGVPMLLGGDELGRTQHGNNNAYCQDNELSWYDWPAADPEALEFTCSLIAFHREHPVFHQRRWFQDRPIAGEASAEIRWFTPDGRELTAEEWQSAAAGVVAVLLNGQAIPFPDPHGRRVVDDDFYVMFNGQRQACTFALPVGLRWVKALDTQQHSSNQQEVAGTICLVPVSVVVLRCPRGATPDG